MKQASILGIKHVIGFLFAVLVMNLVACANHNREVDPGITSKQMEEMLTNVLADTKNSTVKSLFEDPDTAVFMSDSYFGNFGSVNSVLAIYDLSELGISIGFDEINSARVFFGELYVEKEERNAGLIIDIETKNGGSQVYSYEKVGAVEVKNGRYRVMVTNGSQNLILESFDIEVGLFEINKNSADQFKTDIQLMVYALQEGQEVYAGKFPILAGYH